MLEGNRFLPDTGMPMRKIACISRPFALAEPVPLTFASLSAKSLVRTSRAGTFDPGPGFAARSRAPAGRAPSSSARRLFGCSCSIACVRDYEVELLHVPGGRRAALGAQPAVNTDVLVLDHHPAGLRQHARHEQLLLLVGGRHRQ